MFIGTIGTVGRVIAAAAVGAKWNPADKSSAVTLSNGNATATNPSPENFGVRGVTGYASPFTETRTIEYVVAGSPGAVSFGVASAAATLGSNGFFGAAVYRADGSLNSNGYKGDASTGVIVAGDKVQVVIRSGGKNVAFYKNGSLARVITGDFSGTIYPYVAFSQGDNGSVSVTISATPALPEGGQAWG